MCCLQGLAGTETITWQETRVSKWPGLLPWKNQVFILGTLFCSLPKATPAKVQIKYPLISMPGQGFTFSRETSRGHLYPMDLKYKLVNSIYFLKLKSRLCSAFCIPRQSGPTALPHQCFHWSWSKRKPRSYSWLVSLWTLCTVSCEILIYFSLNKVGSTDRDQGASWEQ